MSKSKDRPRKNKKVKKLKKSKHKENKFESCVDSNGFHKQFKLKVAM